MAVTPDNATLIVADSYRHQLVAFAIDADGVLSDRRVWAELGEGVPDGIRPRRRARIAGWARRTGRVLTTEVDVPGAGRP